MKLKKIGIAWLIFVFTAALIVEIALAIPLLASDTLSSNDKIGIPSLMVFVIPILTVITSIPGAILAIVGLVIESNRNRRAREEPTLSELLQQKGR